MPEMSNIFILQLLASFIAGGTLIALLTFIAERVSSRISGVVLAIPSTAALGFFFMGWTVSPESVASIVPGTLIPLGLCILFPVAYIYAAIFFSRYSLNRISQILLSFFCGTFVWFILAIPLIIYRVNNIWISAPVYLIMVVVAHYLMMRNKGEKPKAPDYSVIQKVLRAVFVGFFIVLVVFLGKTLDPFWGGALAMFPVAFSSSLMIIHRNYEPRFLFPAAKKIPVGSLSIFVYNITVMFLFPIFGFIWGTVFSYITSLITTMIILRMSEKK